MSVKTQESFVPALLRSGPVRYERRVAVDIGIPIGRAPEFIPGFSPDPRPFRDLVVAAVEQLRQRSDFVLDEGFGFHLWRRSAGERGIQLPNDWSPDAGLLIRGAIGDRGLRSIREAGLFPGIYLDPPVALVTGGQGPAGGFQDDDVRRAMGVDRWQAQSAPAKVAVAIVDAGLSESILKKTWPHVSVDTKWSWALLGYGVPGSIPSAHGNMCAYDALVSAPAATPIDIAVVTEIEGDKLYQLTSDIFAGLNVLQPLAATLSQPAGSPNRDYDALVISNSWVVPSAHEDDPAIHSSSYFSNSNHFLNDLIQRIEADGADFVFAAGNDPNVKIAGANSLDCVLTVTSVNLNGTYIPASKGPGLISQAKPDIACYAEFRGPDFASNGNTSAACATAAGTIALFRATYPLSKPATVRQFFRNWADPGPSSTHSCDTGYGNLLMPGTPKTP